MKLFDKKFLQILILGIILIFMYKFADSINYVVSWIGSFFGILFPIILGAVIAFFINKPVGKMENIFKKIKWKFISKKARFFALISVYAIVIAVIAVVVNYIAPKLYTNIRELARNIPRYTNQIEAFLSQNNFQFNEEVLESIESKLMELFDFDRIAEYISVVKDIASSFLSFFISIVISAYLILDKENIFAFFKRVKSILFNNKATDVIVYYGRKGINLFYSYFSGLTFDAALMGIITAIILSIFGVPYSVLLGVIVAMGNLIPFFGAIVSNIVVYVIVSFSFGPIKALWILLFQFALGQIDGNLIQPKIVGDSVGISPLLVLISVTVFGELFGPVGMIIGAPLMAVIRIVINDFLDSRSVNS